MEFVKYDKVLHLSHNDADGYGCQVVSYLALSKYNIPVEYYNVSYDKVTDIVEYLVDNKLNKDTLFLITDLNLTKDIIDYIDSAMLIKGFDLILLDHHVPDPTVDVGSIDWYYLDRNVSATTMTYRYFYFNDTNYPIWVRSINNSDIYKKSTEEDLHYFLHGKVISSFIARYISTLEFEFEVMPLANSVLIPSLAEAISNITFDVRALGSMEQELLSRFKTNLSKHIPDDNIISIPELFHIRYLNVPIDDMLIGLYLKYMLNDDLVYKTHLYSFNGYKVLYFDNLQNSNLIANILLNYYEDIDMIIIKGNNGIGFRSIEDRVDVSVIAREYGGGGHPCASGCKMFDIENMLERVI